MVPVTSPWGSSPCFGCPTSCPQKPLVPPKGLGVGLQSNRALMRSTKDLELLGPIPSPGLITSCQVQLSF